MRLTEIKRPGRKHYAEELLEIVRFAPIVWHSTTPKNFQCEAGCHCCCGSAFYYPSEIPLLSRQLKMQLDPVDKYGTVMLKWCQPNGCQFNLGKNGYSCAVNGQEPIRCQMYPYWPIIVRNKIVIMAEPLCDIFDTSTKTVSPLKLCYGLGKGQDVSKRIERIARNFLEKRINETPGELAANIFNKTGDLLSPIYQRFHKTRVFDTHKEALPTIWRSYMMFRDFPTEAQLDQLLHMKS
jgi:hypothetical protein